MAGRKSHPLAARIKRLMQKDEDVGRIASATPILIGDKQRIASRLTEPYSLSRALELFLKRLCSNVADYAKQRQAKTITTGHLKAYVKSDEMMDFLKDIVSSAPDLGTEEASQVNPQRRRSRSVSESDLLGPSSSRGRGRGRGRGGGRGRGRRRSLDVEGMLNEASVGTSMDLSDARSPKRSRMNSLPQGLPEGKALEEAEHMGGLTMEALMSTGGGIAPAGAPSGGVSDVAERGTPIPVPPPVSQAHLMNAVSESGESVQLTVASPFAKPPPELASSLGLVTTNVGFMPVGVFPGDNQVLAEEDDYDVDDEC